MMVWHGVVWCREHIDLVNARCSRLNLTGLSSHVSCPTPRMFGVASRVFASKYPSFFAKTRPHHSTSESIPIRIYLAAPSNTRHTCQIGRMNPYWQMK